MSRLRTPLAVAIVAAAVAVIALNVNTVPNSPPVGVADRFEVAKSTRLVVDAPGLLVNDIDPDGDRIATAFRGEPDHGTVVAVADDGAFVYEPDLGFVGTDSFSYAVRDHLGSFTGSVVDVTITVTGASPAAAPMSAFRGAPPRAVDDAAAMASAAGIPTTATKSNGVIPAAVLGAGLLVIAIGVQRARNEAAARVG